MQSSDTQDVSRPNRYRSPGKTVLDNLGHLALFAQEAKWDECDALVRIICKKLLIEDAVETRETRQWLVAELLQRVTTGERNKAIKAGSPSISKGEVITTDGRLDSHPFLVAAASELLGLSDEQAFSDVRRVLRLSDQEWEKLCDKEQWRPKRIRQLRAGLWLGEREKKDYSSKRTRGNGEVKLLKELEKAINNYLGKEPFRRSLHADYKTYQDQLNGERPPTRSSTSVTNQRLNGPRTLTAKDRLIAHSRDALTDERRLIIPLQRRANLKSVFLPAVHEALREPRIVAIYATAGLGKSVLLAQLYDEITRDEGFGAVFISAAAKPSRRPRNTAKLNQQFGEAVGRSESLTTLLTRQRAAGLRTVVFLDTLDLILDDISRPLLASWMRQLIDDGIPVIFTCRAFEFREQFEPHAERVPLIADAIKPLPIYPLSKDETIAFARAYLTANANHSIETSEKFVDRLLHLRAKRQAVVEICGNPLLLALACQLYAQDGVPEDLTVARLYQSYWDQNVMQDPRRPLPDSEPFNREQLCLTAARSLLSASKAAFAEEFNPYAKKFKPNELNKTGLLRALRGLQSAGVIVSANAPRVRFFHQSFTEYVMARYLRDQPAKRATFLTTLRAEGRSSHLWPVVVQLLYVLGDEDSYAQAIEALDLEEQFAYRAVALSAVNRGDKERIQRLVDRGRTLPATHQDHLVEALASAAEDLVPHVMAVVVRMLKWIDKAVIFPAVAALGDLVGRHTGNRSKPISTAIEAVRNLRSRMSTLDERDQLISNMLEKLVGLARPLTADELGTLRTQYAHAGTLGRATIVRIHLSASVDEVIALLRIARDHRAPSPARSDFITLMSRVLDDPTARQNLDWSTWQDLLSKTYGANWEDIQCAAVTDRIVGTNSVHAPDLSQLFAVALGSSPTAAQRALYIAEHVARSKPERVARFLLNCNPATDGRTAGLVRAVLAPMPPLEHAAAAKLLNWLALAVKQQPRQLIQAGAFAAAGHPDLLKCVLRQAAGKEISSARTMGKGEVDAVRLTGKDYDRVVAKVLDHCPANGLFILMPELRGLLNAQGAKSELGARVAGLLAPIDAEARERCESLALGGVGTHARAAAGRMADTAKALDWFDAALAAKLLSAPTPGVVEIVARWIRTRQRGGSSPLPDELASAAQTALANTVAAPVAGVLLEVLEADVRAGGPTHDCVAELVNTIITRIDLSNVRRAADSEDSPTGRLMDLDNTLTHQALLLLRHVIDSDVASETTRSLLLQAFRILPLDEFDEAEDHVDRLVRKAEQVFNYSFLDELLEQLATWPSRVQLGITKAVRGIRGESSRAYRSIGARTNDPRVLAYLACKLT